MTTDGALDYANWLDRQIESFHAAIYWWLVSPQFAGDPAKLAEHAAAVEAAATWLKGSGWLTWRQEWKTYLEAIRAGWFARVNSWYTTRDRWHARFIEFGASAKAAGMGPPADVAARPREPLEQPGAGLGLPSLTDASGAISDVGWGLGALLAGVAAVMFVRAAK